MRSLTMRSSSKKNTAMIGTRNAFAGWRQSVELAEIRSQQLEFDDHRVIGDVEARLVVALVGNAVLVVRVVTHHVVVTVEHLTSGHDLVVRVAVERMQCAIELVGHLGVHVFFDDCQPTLP